MVARSLGSRSARHWSIDSRDCIPCKFAICYASASTSNDAVILDMQLEEHEGHDEVVNFFQHPAKILEGACIQRPSGIPDISTLTEFDG